MADVGLAPAMAPLAVDAKAVEGVTANENAHIELIVASIRKEMQGKLFNRKKLYSLIIASISVTMKLAISDGEKKKALIMKAFKVILDEQKEITDADREEILAATDVGITLLYYQKKMAASVAVRKHLSFFIQRNCIIFRELIFCSFLEFSAGLH